MKRSSHLARLHLATVVWAGLWLAAAPGAAKKSDPNVELEFVPQAGVPESVVQAALQLPVR